LGAFLGHQKEVIGRVVFLILDDTLVNDSTRRRVRQAVVIAHKEPLLDSLVHDHQSQIRSRGCSVVHEVDCICELLYLSLDDLLLHAISDTISVDDEVLGVHMLLRVLCKCLYRSLQGVSQFAIDHFLTTGQHNSLGIVLAHARVDRSTKSNIGMLAFVAHINANKHGKRVDTLGNLQMVQVSTELHVDLSQNI